MTLSVHTFLLFQEWAKGTRGAHRKPPGTWPVCRWPFSYKLYAHRILPLCLNVNKCKYMKHTNVWEIAELLSVPGALHRALGLSPQECCVPCLWGSRNLYSLGLATTDSSRHGSPLSSRQQFSHCLVAFSAFSCILSSRASQVHEPRTTDSIFWCNLKSCTAIIGFLILSLYLRLQLFIRLHWYHPIFVLSLHKEWKTHVIWNVLLFVSKVSSFESCIFFPLLCWNIFTWDTSLFLFLIC